MKLKTVNDLIFHQVTPSIKKMFPDYVFVSELKQEAIKWVKHYKGCMENAKSDIAWHYYKGCMEATMTQNNIIEEDLKGGIKNDR